MTMTESIPGVILSETETEIGGHPSITYDIDGRRVVAAFVLVSVQLALKWLEVNSRNRDEIKANLAQLIKDRNEGKWVFNGATVVFDADGRLSDGQHRLKMIVATKTPTVMLVVMGVEPLIAQDTTDVGSKRSLANQLTVRGEVSGRNLAAALVQLQQLTAGARGRGRLTIRDGVELLDANPLIRESVPVGSRLNATIGYPPGLAAALHYLFRMEDEEDAAAFFDSLKTGVDLKDGDPILTLRNRMLSMAADVKGVHRKGIDPFYRAAITIKAWNAWREGKPLHLLKWNPGGANPESFPSWKNPEDTP